MERTEEVSFIIRNYWVECTEEIEFRLIGDILHMVYHCIFRHIVKPVNGNVGAKL